MKILSIKLSGYDRFSLNHYPVFTYSPVQRIQLIVGTNGSGKSSLLEEASPLPSDKSNYKPGGSKIIKIEHNGSMYTLTSSFKQSTPKHSFIVHGDIDEELNQGGTASVQRDLVEKIFSITPEIHSVMIGRERFTTMSVAKRREWFTKISKMDFNYAIDVYNRFKSRLKDTEQFLKFQHSLLLTETNKLSDMTDRDKLEKEIYEYQEILDILIEARDAISINKNLPSDAEFIGQLNDANVDYRTILRKLIALNYKGDISRYINSIKELEKRIALNTASYNDLGKRIEQYQSDICQMKKLNIDKKTDVGRILTSLSAKIESYRKLLKYLPEDISIETTISSINLAHDSLFDTLQNMPNNDDRYYSKDTYIKFVNDQTDIRNKILKLRDESMNIKRQLDTYEYALSNHKTTCPNCNHTWIRNFDESIYVRLKQRTIEIDSEIMELEKTDNDLTIKIQEISNYFDQYRLYMKVTDNIQTLSHIWDLINKEKILFISPKKILYILEQAKSELNVIKIIQELKNKQTDLEKMKETSELSIVNDISNLELQIQNSLVDFASLQKSIEEDKELLVKNEEIVSLHKRLTELFSVIEKLYNEGIIIADNDISKLRYVSLQELIRSISTNIGDLKKNLFAAKTQETVVSKIQQTISELSLEKETLNAMVCALSPRDGIIARSMSNFLNHFLSRVNRLIEQIWTYPFELLPVNDNDNDLDLNYRFVISVKNKKIIPDISSCSSGMQEVIDLAFRITSMQYLGLNTFPIYLDEFGKSMDSTHRIKAFNVVTNLILHSTYSQLFVISHYEQAYGGIANCDIVVLNPDNIIIPPGSIVNQTVMISERED